MGRRTSFFLVGLVIVLLCVIAYQSNIFESQKTEAPQKSTDRPLYKDRPIYERVPGPPLCRDWYVRCGYQGMPNHVCEQEYIRCLNG